MGMNEQCIDKAIVMTSIYSPTKAVSLYAKLPGYQLIVVGDRKTPVDWFYPDTVFISASQQQDEALMKELPWDHYSRKMIGYLYAITNGAQLIIDTDDDNLPLPSWSVPDFCNEYLKVPENLGFVNAYSYFTHQKIWPRGFPLNLIQAPVPEAALLKTTSGAVGIWQGLVDGDPDVDAIYRLTRGTDYYFDQKPPVVLAKGTICPFNSQNTVFNRKLFPLLYLPITATFRFTDILRSLIAQPIMWANNLLLGFFAPNVLQERNSHDYLIDFLDELPCYLYVDKIAQIATNTVKSDCSICDNLYNVYSQLVNQGFLFEKEMRSLEAWMLNF
jgi:hypothetical protein